MTTVRSAVLINALFISVAFAVAWLDSDRGTSDAQATDSPEWVRTRDGWQRPDWRRPRHRDALHPALVAGLMAAGSTLILIGLDRAGLPVGTTRNEPPAKEDHRNEPDFRATVPLDLAAARRGAAGSKGRSTRKNFSSDPSSFYARNILSMRKL